MSSPSWTAGRKVELLLQLIRGEANLAEVCRTHGLDKGDVESWVRTLLSEPDVPASGADEQQLRLIIDTIPTMAWCARPDGSADFVNQRWLAYTGLPVEMARDWSWAAALHPEDVDSVVDRWRTIIASRDPGELEARLRCWDGAYRWFLFRAAPSLDEHGNVVRWYGTISDIEDRKHAEEEVHERERTLRLLFESIPGMIVVNAADGPLEYVNQRLLSFTGRTFADLEDLGWARILHPSDADAVVNEWLQSLQTGRPLDVTFRIQRNDGVYRWFHSRTEPLFDERGRLTRWYSLLWDIDERKQADAALQASEHELRQLIDTFPGMVSVANADGVHEYSNRRVVNFLGRELGGIGFRRDIHPDDLAAVGNEWRRCATTGVPLNITYRLRRHDGVYRWVTSRAEPLRNEHGNILRWYSLLMDVDDQKRAEEALQTSQAELAHLTRVMTMGELTASIAHEINQPLAAVVNNANACLTLLPDDAPQLGDVRDALGDIVDDATRASAILARVRQLSRKAPFESALINLRDIVADVLALARHESIARRVTIHAELPDELPLVLGDRVQLQQVLLNLVVNGMDAMRATEESQRLLTVRAYNETLDGTSALRLSVQDTGVGLTPGETEKLFEAFYSTKPQGMGMGLSISRSIIAAHGGRLWAEPNRGPGATFVFTLPNASQSA